MKKYPEKIAFTLTASPLPSGAGPRTTPIMTKLRLLTTLYLLRIDLEEGNKRGYIIPSIRLIPKY